MDECLYTCLPLYCLYLAIYSFFLACHPYFLLHLYFVSLVVSQKSLHPRKSPSPTLLVGQPIFWNAERNATLKYGMDQGSKVDLMQVEDISQSQCEFD